MDSDANMQQLPM